MCEIKSFTLGVVYLAGEQNFKRMEPAFLRNYFPNSTSLSWKKNLKKKTHCRSHAKNKCHRHLVEKCVESSAGSDARQVALIVGPSESIYTIQYTHYTYEYNTCIRAHPWFIAERYFPDVCRLDVISNWGQEGSSVNARSSCMYIYIIV